LNWLMNEELPAEELLARVGRRDLAALDELYDRYAPRVFGLITHILASRAEAEEILQEVFLRLWSESKRLGEEGGSVAVWLIVTSREAALERLRTQRTGRLCSDAQREGGVAKKWADAKPRSAKILASASLSSRTVSKSSHAGSRAGKPGPAGPAKVAATVRVSPAWLPRPGEIELIDDRLGLLHKVINQLPHSQRQALELAVYGGLSEEEIAAELGESLAKVRTGLRAAVTFVKHRRRAILGTWAADI
jgi:RNA polymerase sigma factor (sigma-70 family)